VKTLLTNMNYTVKVGWTCGKEVEAGEDERVLLILLDTRRRARTHIP
jgi:hypothetical protein